MTSCVALAARFTSCLITERPMADDTRNIPLYARLVDLHRRRTEAEMMGKSTVVYDALIKVYRLDIDEIEASRRAKEDAV